MKERRRILVLITVMATACLTVGAAAIFLLYRTAFAEARARLVETAQSQARLIEAVARFDAQFNQDYPHGPQFATLSKIVDAHKNYRGFGQTGEFTLARREGDLIVFLLSHRHFDLQNPKPVAFHDPKLAEPMRRALTGASGTVIAFDYRGEKVLAAHEPVRRLNFGIVAKIDLAEVRAPFVRTGIMVFAVAALVVVAGAGLHWRVSHPMIVQLQERSTHLTAANDRLRQEIFERKAAGAALRKSEEQLKISLGEKNVLLKEVHHRVKNNLQIIAGLLNMSSMRATHQEAKEMLQDARTKVYAMALIHTQLYQTDRFDIVNMGSHIRLLVDQLAQAYRDPQQPVHATVGTSDVRLTLNQAIPCGLVINELVSNAFKHAFDGRQGVVHVSINRDGEENIVLRVKDNGAGLPEDVQLEEMGTMGMELVRRLVKQLKGDLTIEARDGMEAVVRFKSERSEAAHV